MVCRILCLKDEAKLALNYANYACLLVVRIMKS